MTDIGSRARAGAPATPGWPQPPWRAAGALAMFIATQPAFAATAPGVSGLPPVRGPGRDHGHQHRPEHISGNLGVCPGTAVTGFPPGIVTDRRSHGADAVAMGAQPT